MEGPRKIVLENISSLVAKRQAEYLVGKQLYQVGQTGYPHRQHNVYALAGNSNQVQMLHNPKDETITLFDLTINRSTPLSDYLLPELRYKNHELLAHEGALPDLASWN